MLSVRNSDRPFQSRPLRLSWTSVRSWVSSIFFCGVGAAARPAVRASSRWSRPLPAWNLTKKKTKWAGSMTERSGSEGAGFVSDLMSQRRSAMYGAERESNPRHSVHCSRYKTPAEDRDEVIRANCCNNYLMLSLFSSSVSYLIN